MQDLRSTAARLAQEDYSFSPGDAIRRAWELFRYDAGSYLGFLLILFVISAVINIIPFVNIVGGIFTSIISAGIYIYANKDNFNQNPTFNDFFGGFKFAKDIIIQQLIVLGISLAIFSPIVVWVVSEGITSSQDFAMFAMSNNGLPNWLLMLMIPLALASIFFSVTMIFSIQFVLFGGMSAWEGIVASFQVIRRKWWNFFGFMLLLGLLNVLGFLALVLGLLVTVPVSIIAVYTAFADVVHLSEGGNGLDHLIDEIGSQEAE